jgi:alkylation response protein AidB-like acyl-CoA dehydrogenase
MNLSFSADDLAFRQTVREFFETRLTPRLARSGALMTSVYAAPEIAREWQSVLNQQGWAAPAWPKAHGGCGWTPVQSMIFAEERAHVAAPPISPMGVGMIGPVLIHYGTDEQKAFFLPRTLSTEIFWCQGYSEPDAGSDLAALRMRAIDDGEAFVCNGVKTWSTYAQASRPGRPMHTRPTGSSVGCAPQRAKERSRALPFC